jgi:hypothetical protein
MADTKHPAIGAVHSALPGQVHAHRFELRYLATGRLMTSRGTVCPLPVGSADVGLDTIPASTGTARRGQMSFARTRKGPGAASPTL